MANRRLPLTCCARRASTATGTLPTPARGTAVDRSFVPLAAHPTSCTEPRRGAMGVQINGTLEYGL
eukprot:1897086-Pyramimonas_sp.AAC.1